MNNAEKELIAGIGQINDENYLIVEDEITGLRFSGKDMSIINSAILIARKSVSVGVDNDYKSRVKQHRRERSGFRSLFNAQTLFLVFFPILVFVMLSTVQLTTFSKNLHSLHEIFYLVLNKNDLIENQVLSFLNKEGLEQYITLPDGRKGFKAMNVMEIALTNLDKDLIEIDQGQKDRILFLERKLAPKLQPFIEALSINNNNKPNLPERD